VANDGVIMGEKVLLVENSHGLGGGLGDLDFGLASGRRKLACLFFDARGYALEVLDRASGVVVKAVALLFQPVTEIDVFAVEKILFVPPAKFIADRATDGKEGANTGVDLVSGGKVKVAKEIIIKNSRTGEKFV